MMKENLKFLGIGILWSVLLVFPHIVHDLPFGYESYFHMRMAKTTDSPTTKLTDNLFKGGRPLPATPLHWGLSFFKDIPFYMRVLPAIFGIFMYATLYLVLRKIKLEPKQRIYILILFILSPVFMRTFIIFNDLFLVVSLSIFAVLLLFYDKYILSALILCLLPFLNINSLFILLLLLILIYHKQMNVSSFAVSSMFIGLTLGYIFLQDMSPVVGFGFDMLRTRVSDFGATFGSGIFTIALASAGMLLSWKNKGANAPLYVLMGCSTVLSFFQDQFVILSEFLLIYFASFALMKISSAKWELPILKDYTMLLIICGLIFSSGSFLNRIIALPPSIDEVESLEWLSINSIPGQTVLSDYEYGHMIQEIAGLPVVIDSKYVSTSEQKTRLKDAEMIFRSQSLTRTEEMLNKYGIRYIWINEKMKNGQVWSREDKGLLFLLDNNEKFKRIHQAQGVDIWEYLG